MISMPHPHQDVYLPSSEEIRARCLDIQASWTPEEKERRRGTVRPRQRYSSRIVTCHLDAREMELIGN